MSWRLGNWRQGDGNHQMAEIGTWEWEMNRDKYEVKCKGIDKRGHDWTWAFETGRQGGWQWQERI